MRRLFLNVLNIFYRYYDKGATQFIAYESALLALLLLLYLNAFAVFNFYGLNIGDYLQLGKEFKTRNYIIVFIIVTVLFVLLKKLFKEEDVADFPEELQIKGGSVLLLLYSISSVLLLIYSIQ